MSIPRYSYHLLAFPQSSQYLTYFNDQLSFARSLSDEARKVLLVRPCSQDFGWDQRSRWAEHCPTVKLDTNNKPFQKVLSGARLVVASYNATTFLETFSLNIPTIIFWNPHHWELNPQAVVDFQKLEEVGIFHRNPESAAAKVSEVYQNVKEWWQQAEIQEIRIQFCSKYSNAIEHPVKVLKKILHKETGN
jgi:putative transferase (TIGR04331 family)